MKQRNPPPPPIPAGVRQLELALPEDIELYLKPYFIALTLCFDEAWRLWTDMASAVARQFQMIGARSRANLIYDFVCDSVKARFGDDSDVKFSKERGFLLMVVKDRFVLRFKKLDRNKLTCKGHTAGHKAYFSHQLTLPGMPAEATRLVLGYQLDAAQADISDVLLTFQWENALVWFQSIKEVAVELEQKSEPETPRKPRVRATVIPKIADSKRSRERKDQGETRDDSDENPT